MKCVKNEMSLSFPSHSCNESYARSAVCAFVSPLDPTLEELSDLRTAVSEAVTNAIVHGYADRLGSITIGGRIYPDGRMVLSIRDRGQGIEDIAQAMEPLFTTSKGERAGLGFAVMESMMDRIRVASKVGKGTTVTLDKKIRGKMI
jgi:stage II sporulation protein AB (anti-sigma F factor)